MVYKHGGHIAKKDIHMLERVIIVKPKVTSVSYEMFLRECGVTTPDPSLMFKILN